MEELLNKLIEKGWKPFGDKDIAEIHKDYGTERFYFEYEHYPVSSEYFYLRHLTSKESGLWQFVCENGIIENGKTVHDYVISHITYSYDRGCGGYAPNNSEFWIMMSALCDEDKLEKFLLDNIKI